MTSSPSYLRRVADEILLLIESHQADLDALDRVAADGDHGATFVMAWRSVSHAMSRCESDDPCILLRTAAEAFASVGGSIGPLWGLALLEASRDMGAGESPDSAVSAGIAAMQEIGRSSPGDKTLLDAAIPAGRAFAASLSAGHVLADALDAGRQAAWTGMESTVTLEARRGRASRLPDRSRGHIDAGAASMALVWEAAARAHGLSPRSPHLNVSGRGSKMCDSPSHDA